jgi:hypothetical protein
VVDSTIQRTGGRLKVSREGARQVSDIQDARLKRLLLKDPQGASYWDAIREGIGISLGDASGFVLSVLLADVLDHTHKTGLLITDQTSIILRYSLPNWIGPDPEHNAARRRMFQPAAVVSCLLANGGFTVLPHVGQDVLVSGWRRLVSLTRDAADCQRLFQAFPGDFGSMVEQHFSVGMVTWRLAAESSAAGFPPLQRFLISSEHARKTQDHWVKLLVVDVEAGSTDAGYFVSSRKVKDGTLLLNYLQPARTLDYAGEQLTEMLREYYMREKYSDMTIREAEILKLSAPDQWKAEPFVGEWRARIARSVGDYMFRVPDNLRLGESAIPGLMIVLTGGSGLVDGLDRAILDEV